MDRYRSLHVANGSGILVPSIRVMYRYVRIRIKRYDSTYGIDGH